MAEETPAAVAEQGGIPQLDFSTFPNQIFWLAVFLLILFLIVSRVALPTIEGIQTARRNRISENLEDADRAVAEAESVRKATSDLLAEAKSEAESIAADTRTRIRDIQDREMTRVSDEIAVMAGESEKRIRGINAEAPDRIQEIVSAVVPDIIDFVLPRQHGGGVSRKGGVQ